MMAGSGGSKLKTKTWLRDFIPPQKNGNQQRNAYKNQACNHLCPVWNDGELTFGPKTRLFPVELVTAISASKIRFAVSCAARLLPRPGPSPA